MRDCREHRKQVLYLALADTDWRDITQGTNVNEAIGLLEQKIHSLMDKYMPLRSVRMSSCDLVWMTPLVKSMFQAKSGFPRSPINGECLKVIYSRILEVISQNLKNPSNILGSSE